MDPSYIVVDGSNIATEGRSAPSLAQLDEAVRELQTEYPDDEVIVVVDATFGHRIDPAERKAFDEAVAHAEVVSPPAGAVGRGDAFLLRVAERVNGRVLSNDSFQEFHGEHPWLFDEDRLIGGKRVPGAGWIFTPRNPVRGARSRAAMSAGGSASPRTRRGRRSGSAAPDTDQAGLPDKAASATKTEKAAKADKPAKAGKAAKTTKAEKVSKTDKAAKADKTTKAEKAAKTDKAVKATKTAKADKADKADKAAKADKADKPTKATKTATAPKKAARSSKAVPGATEPVSAGGAAPEQGAEEPPTTRRRRRRGRRATGEDVRAAIDLATVEAIAPPQPGEARHDGDAVSDDGPARRRRRGGEPPPAVNDPLTFLTFVSEHPVGTTVEGTVSTFVSHGAMVDVGGSMVCYVPLAGLGVPPPRGAREVLERGDRRQFVLVALDPARRGAELALPDVYATRQPG